MAHRPDPALLVAPTPRPAFYVDDAHNRHNNPNWSGNRKNELAELLREQIRHEHTVEEVLADWDAFTAKIPATLTAAHAFLDAARPHAFTYLDPTVRKALACIGGPELATGVIERLMREINARTDIGGVRWTVTGHRPTRHAHRPDRQNPATPHLDRNPQEPLAIE